MKLCWYLDEDTMARALVTALRARGVNLLTPIEAGMMGMPDADQLAFAAAQQRVIYTFNVGDFCRLHNEYIVSGSKHFGIVVVPRQRYSIGQQVRGISLLTETIKPEDMQSNLVLLQV